MAVEDATNFVGFETRGLEEANRATVGSPVANTSVPVRTGSSSLKLLGATTAPEYSLGNISPSGTPGDIIGFQFHTNNITPTADVDFYEVEDTSAGIPIILRLKTDGDVDLIRDGSVAATVTSPFTANHWHLVEVGSYVNATLGVFIVDIDGVNHLDESGVDTFASATVTDKVTLRGGTTTGEDIAIDDLVYRDESSSGNVIRSEFFSPVEVYMKQGAQIGATPDTSDLADTDLDEQTWQLVSETPLNEQAVGSASAGYTGGASAGVVYADGSGDKLGPNGDDRFLGTTIKAVKAIGRMSRGGGGATDQFLQVGNDGGAASDLSQSADLDLSNGAYTNESHLVNTAAVLPSLTEHAAIGFSKNAGGQDLDVAEMWCMILTVPAAPTITALSDSDLKHPDWNSFVGPFEV